MSRPSVLFVRSHRAKIPRTEGVVPGSRSAVNARREVWTPTTEVYRAKGKYAGSEEGSGCVREGLVSVAFRFREGMLSPRHKEDGGDDGTEQSQWPAKRVGLAESPPLSTAGLLQQLVLDAHPHQTKVSTFSTSWLR